MAALDDRKAKHKQSTIFMQVAAGTFYQTARNLFHLKYYYHLTIKTPTKNPTFILTVENNISAYFKRF